jgi:hypothetical protein
MTLAIDLPPDVERALEEGARQSGQSVAEFAAGLLARAARLGRENGSVERQTGIAGRLAALERIGCYDTRVQAGLQALADEASSRASIYEGRGL